ncbi:CPBP family intramembrane glutamic endopeptidase [Tsukamurella sp. 1534]|uniref:CPBP family intramembrane glutamic endopeptidase n=1 Tax=Tsukamurella sp. 1534 TaxID=1151061 RepID=UPI0002F55659|nr:CPBP family intramembrane glutamic endopeptidase [Tsukamurella sp. 1534]
MRPYVDVAVVVAVLVATNLVAHFTGSWAALVAVPISAVLLIGIARHRGLDWHELGLGREHWRSGAKYAAAAVLLVVTVIAIGALLPATRGLFLNDRYATFSTAVIASMVIIPLQTVIPEELAFRGALHGTLSRALRFRWVMVTGSLLFGFWHIASSLGLTSGNAGLTKILGAGPLAQIAGIAGAVVATAFAGWVFTWLRARSGSLIAPIALHWCLNGAGALAAAFAWQLLR